MDTLIFYGAYLFGFAIVFIYSAKEFNKPEYEYGSEDKNSDLDQDAGYTGLAKPTLPKYMADKTRYTVFMLLFSMFSVAIYFLFTKLLMMIPELGWLGENNHNREALIAVIAALVLVGVVKADEIQIGKMQFFLAWPKTLMFDLIKDWLHGFAFIPRLNFNIFNMLCYVDLDMDSVVVQENLQQIAAKQYRDDIDVSKYIEISDFKFAGNPNNLNARWSRLSYLIFCIGKWSDNPQFANQVKERSLGWLKLKSAYVGLIDKITDFRDKDVQMSQDEEKDLSDQVNKLLANCNRLVSCVAVMTAKPSEDPLKYISEIGFKVKHNAQSFARQGEFFRILFAMVPTIFAITYLFTLVDDRSIPQMFNSILIYVESAMIIMFLPIVMVIGLKRHLSIDNTWRVVPKDEPYQSIFDRPLILYSAISIATWVLSLLLMMLLISKNGLEATRVEWKYMAVFSFVSAISAFITCIRVDTPPRAYPNQAKLISRILGVPLVQGLLTALTVWIGLHLVPEIPADSLAFLKFPLMGFAIAMAIGVSLFYGKHSLEKREIDDREDCYQPVTIIQDEQQYYATMLNRSANGMMVMFSQARSIFQSGKKIEVVFEDGLRKIGSIVNLGADQMSIAYIDR